MAPTEPATPAGGLTLTVLGCDGSWPGPGGACSGYLVRSATTTVLLDAGPGTFANLQLACDPATLDAVVLSHHHPDHWTDLHGLETHARFAAGAAGITVLAPAGLDARTGLAGSPVLAWRTVTDRSSEEIGDLTLRFSRTQHAGETLAVRVSGAGRSIGYSADSGPGWALAELGTGLDLVLCEATYTAADEGRLHHLSGRQAGEQARRAGARRLVVTHRWPTVDAGTLVAEAASAFGGPVDQAVIGKEFKL